MAIKIIRLERLISNLKMGGFRDKPSKSHIIWTRRTRKGATNRRFDYEHFEQWAEHHSFDFDTRKRVDHDRAEEPRMQFRCVFAWGQMNEQSFEVGDEEWELAGQKTPRTFIEIDQEGIARVKGWSHETVYNIQELRHDGPALLLKTTDGETKKIDGRKLTESPETES